MSISLTSIFPWIFEKMIYPLISWVIPKIANYLMSKIADRHIFIDDITTSISDKTVMLSPL